MSLLRRRMMMAIKPESGGGDWSYELHLTPEWHGNPNWVGGYVATMYGDFSTLNFKASEMCKKLGISEYENIWFLDEVPVEFNVTIDGYPVIMIELVYGTLSLYTDKCTAMVYDDYLDLESDLLYG